MKTNLVVTVLLGLSAAGLVAQERRFPFPTVEPTTAEPPKPAARRGPTLREHVAAQIELIQSAKDLDDAAKAELLKRYKAAVEWLESADENHRQAAQYEADVQQKPQRIAEAKAKLAAPATGDSVPPDATLDELETALEQTSEQLQEAEEVLDELEDELKHRGERKAELARLIDETKQRIEDVQDHLQTPSGADEDGAVAAARRTELEARLVALESQLRLHKAEARRHEALADLLPLQRDLAARDHEALEAEVAVCEQLIAKRRKAETESQAREARQQAEHVPPAIRAIAERNALLAEQRKAISEAIEKATAEVSRVEQQLSDLQDRFQEIETKFDLAGRSTAIGLVLRKLRGELPAVPWCESRIAFVGREMPRANLLCVDLEAERAALSDLERATRDTVAKLPPGHDPALAGQIRQLLETRRELLDELLSDYETYVGKLSELEVTYRKLLAETERVAAYIDEHVLWIRSSEPLRAKDATAALHGLSELTTPARWIALARHCGLDALRQPWTAALVVVFAALLVAGHSRLRKAMRERCQIDAGGSTLRIRPTFEAIVLAGMIAAEWPLLVAYFGWRMTRAVDADGFGRAVGSAWQYVAVVLWAVSFVRQICAPGGVAESHFQSAANSLASLRRHLLWLAYLGLPLAFVTVFAHVSQQGQWNDSLGRVVFIAAMCLLSGFMHSILRHRDNVLREALTRQPDGWLRRMQGLAYVVGAGVPFVLAGLAAVGYYYSAQQLTTRLQATFALAGAIVLVYAFVSRWFLVQRRNRALEQVRQRQAEPADGPEAVVRPRNRERDIAAMHEQLQYLLRQAMTVAVFVGGWLVWTDVLPAFKVLDAKVLWWNSVEVVERHEGADGKIAFQKVSRDTPTTLRHALVAGMLLIGTWIVGKNLPALLEFTLLERLPFDRGGRHAISVIARYGVAIAGVAWAFKTMSIAWSSVQWLAAGMTVGLGFGLQEIFANFISGLILLFERPIRVGDVITLGDITGTVTDIRIRATTVTTGERKELIVPNKELITGKLLNWTLTDSTNRIVINVGVSYDADPRQALRLLTQLATQHPNVMAEPAPQAAFESFGDSTLNFTVSAFLSRLDQRSETVTDLHTAIHETFRREGIEIAFPQRDINIRSIKSISLPALAWPEVETKAA